MKTFEVLKAIRSSPVPTIPNYKLGTITSIDITSPSNPRPIITFDGETEAATDLVLTWVSPYCPRLNDRVLLMRTGKTWVMLGKITSVDGLWYPATPIAPWQGSSAASGVDPEYMFIDGRIFFRGRLDYGGTAAAGTTIDVLQLSISKDYTGAQVAGTYGGSTGTGAMASVVVRMGTAGLIQVVVPTGVTMQRWLHLDGLHWPIK